jgi:hypothetical protein
MAGRRRILLGGGAVLLAVAVVAGTALALHDADGRRADEPGRSTTAAGRSSAEPSWSSASGAPAPSNALGAPTSDQTTVVLPLDAVGAESSTGSWWRRVPPVAGVLTAPDGQRIGRVTVLATDSATLTVTVFGDGPLPDAATTSVLTSTLGGEVDLGAVGPEVRVVVYVLDAPEADRLPDPVRALELRAADGAVVASAVLLPV